MQTLFRNAYRQKKAKLLQSLKTLVVSNLLLERGDRDLCRDLSFQIESGEMVRIAGENGAGKSTLLKALVGLLTIEDGCILYNGEDVTRHKDRLLDDCLYIGHSVGIKSIFSVTENLRWYCPDVDEKAVDAALTAVSLTGYQDTPAAQLSAGQKRRIALARLWLTDKPIWFLDEPFTALDVDGVSALEQRLIQHTQSGGIVLLTTHQALSAHLAVKEIRLLV